MNDIHANPVGIVKKDIYVITNKINDKVYVGQSIDANRRFHDHCKNYKKDVSLINRSIKKYGKENFEMRILEHQIENYNERETYWIKELNSHAPNGYNLTDGGENPPCYTGDDSPQSVLSEDDDFQLKYYLEYTKLPLSYLADMFHISKKQVLRINHGISRTEQNRTYPIRKIPNPGGKLTEEEVDTIIEILKYTYFLDGEIAKMFYVDVHAISRINNGKSHHRDNVDYPIRKWKSCGKILFTYEQVTEIIDLLQHSDLSLNRIAKKYNVSVQSIMHINNGSSKKYKRDNIKYPIRRFNNPVTTISAKESRGIISTYSERETP